VLSVSCSRVCLAVRLQELVDYFLVSGSFSANVQDNDGGTALHISCARGHVALTRLLLAHGAHPNSKTVDGTRSAIEIHQITTFIAAHGSDGSIVFSVVTNFFLFLCGHHEPLHCLMKFCTNVYLTISRSLSRSKVMVRCFFVCTIPAGSTYP